MSLKKEKEFRFTFQDTDGVLRSVILQAQHFQEDGHDRVAVFASSDHTVPIGLHASTTTPHKPVKTKTRL
jgi:hypothetical protein